MRRYALVVPAHYRLAQHRADGQMKDVGASHRLDRTPVDDVVRPSGAACER